MDKREYGNDTMPTDRDRNDRLRRHNYSDRWNSVRMWGTASTRSDECDCSTVSNGTALGIRISLDGHLRHGNSLRCSLNVASPQPFLFDGPDSDRRLEQYWQAVVPTKRTKLVNWNESRFNLWTCDVALSSLHIRFATPLRQVIRCDEQTHWKNR